MPFFVVEIDTSEGVWMGWWSCNEAELLKLNSLLPEGVELW